MGLLHPSHWCFSASSQQGCILARLLAQKPGRCWTLNKVSRRHRNHSVLMHLITHTPEYIFTWQFGLSSIKQLMKFLLVQDMKKNPKTTQKKGKLVMLGVQQLKGGRRMDAAFTFSNCVVQFMSSAMVVIVIITAGSLHVFLRVDLMSNLKMIKTEPFIAFTILSPTKTKETCFPSYGKHTDLISLINDNSSKDTSGVQSAAGELCLQTSLVRVILVSTGVMGPKAEGSAEISKLI